MQRVLQNKVVHMAVALFAAFIPLPLIIPAPELYIALGIVSFTTSMAVIMAYWVAIKRALLGSLDELNGTDVLTLAIAVVFIGIGSRAGYVTFFQEAYPLQQRRPDEFYLPLSLFRYMFIVSAVMAMTARSIASPPRHLSQLPGWPYAILSVLAGIIFSVAVLTR